MRKIIFTIIALLLAISSHLVGAASPPKEDSVSRGALVDISPYSVKTGDGASLEGEWSWMQVPESRTKLEGSLIEIPFVRFKTTGPHSASPIFILDSGPGDTPTMLENLEVMAPIFSLFTTFADVIVVEQRGVGHSRPRLDCPGSYSLALDTPADFESRVHAERTYLQRCVEFWHNQGIDISGYNVREMAADVNAVRQALGYEKFSIFGGSFGSHHGLAILRDYGKYVDRALLVLVEGPNHTQKLPSTVQEHLEKLSQRVKQEPLLQQHIPDFIKLVETVLNRLGEAPVTVGITLPETENTVTVTVGKYDLQVTTANMLGRFGSRELPAHYYAMAQGNFSWLAEQALAYRTDRSYYLMPVAVDCASGTTAERQVQIEQEAEYTLLGNAINGTLFHNCDVVGDPDIGDVYRTNLQSDVPVLLISGTQDTRTPVSNGEEVLQGLVNGQHLIVDGATHDMFREAFPVIIEPIIQFLRGDPFAAITSKEIVVPFDFTPLE